MVKINFFAWWLSDTDSRMTVGQFPYAEDLEVMAIPEYVCLAQKPTLELDTTSLNKRMYCGLYAESGNLNNVFFMWEGGNVVDIDNWNTVLTLWYDITACMQYWLSKWTNISENIFFAYDWWSNGYLGIISISDAYNSTNWATESSYNAQYKTLSWDHSEYHMLVWNNALYIAWWRTIDRLSPAGNLENVLTIASEIKAMTDNWTHIRVYTVDWKMYIWDWGSDTPQASIDTGISEIRTAYGTWQQDWVLWWSNKTSSMLHMSNWYSYPVVKRWVDLLSEYDVSLTKYQYFQNNSSNQAIIDHQWMYWILDDDAIWQFGKMYPTSPFAFNKLITRASSWDKFTAVRTLVRAWDTLYYFWETATEEGIDSISIDADLQKSYQPSWSIYSPKFMMGNVARIAFELYLRADVPTNTTMVVKYCLDWSGTRTTLGTLTNTTDKRHILNINAEFNEIQFKFELSTSSSSVTPKLYEYEFIPWPLRREWQS